MATMEIKRTITTTTPVDRVFAWLTDFTTTQEWDPPTQSTTVVSGDGGVGTCYRNVSKVLGRNTEIMYEVRELVPESRFVLEGNTKSVQAHDTMEFRADGTGTRVDYTARFELKGMLSKVQPLLAPLFAPGLKKLGDAAAKSMQQSLDRL